ncbi:polysaccharide lyase family 7 protein, partial [Seonamhaeicola sp.]|uniref:polysaccharide lyase family 7 protein n=1 Tax=Seonamhaeicola sp. TaxID=1912245 RepID=UPI00356580EF
MKKKFILLLPLLAIVLVFNCSSSQDENVNTTEEEQTPEEEQTEQEEETTEENIVWKNWYLSVPLNNGSGSATSIFYQDIVDDNLGPQTSKYFYKNSDGSYTMYTKFTGYTTSGYSELGDKYCRTELREFWRGNQTTTDNWSMATGTHILETTLKVDYVEGNGRTIVAQVHGKETTGLEGAPATIKIRWNSGTIQIDYYTKPDEGEPWTSAFDDKLDIANVDNEIFTFKIKIENGKFYYGLVCESKDINIDYTFVYDYVGNGYGYENYFKTGNYFGWHDDYEKAAQVTLYKVVT